MSARPARLRGALLRTLPLEGAAIALGVAAWLATDAIRWLFLALAGGALVMMWATLWALGQTAARPPWLPADDAPGGAP